MEAERYAGERRALLHFLAELRPLVEAEPGRDTILYHRIDRALKRADLESLRDARRVFHNQPKALKRRLLEGLLDPAPAARPPAAPSPEAGGHGTGPASPPAPASVRFEVAPAEGPRAEQSVSVSLSHRPLEGRPVQVFIRPGTLPRSAAGALRAVADRIEGERRLLSPRYWRDRADDDGGVGAGGAGSSADQA